jgi:CRISPR-associated protein Cas1
MTTVYLTTTGSVVRRHGENLHVWLGQSKLADLRLHEVERIVVVGPVQLTSQAIGLLLDRGIDVSFLTATGRPRGVLVSGKSRNVYLRLAQFDRWKDLAFRLELARAVVVSKLSSQRRLVLRYERNHPGALEARFLRMWQLHRERERERERERTIEKTA